MKSEFVCPSLYSCCVRACVWRRERARGEREGGVEGGESERGKRDRENGRVCRNVTRAVLTI